MDIRPEDKPKMIALGSALLVVILYLVIVQVPKFAAASAPPKTEANAEAGNKPAGPGFAVTPGGAPVDLYAEVEQPSAPKRNPFNSPAPAVPEAGASGRSGPIVRPVIPPELRPWPAIELQGIMQGNGDLAVLKIADRVFCVRAGERLDDDVKVVRIAATTVELSQGRKRITIGIGHAIEPDIKPMPVTGLPALQAPPGGRPTVGIPVASAATNNSGNEGTIHVEKPSDILLISSRAPLTGHDALEADQHRRQEDVVVSDSAEDVLDPLKTSRRPDITTVPKRRDSDPPDG